MGKHAVYDAAGQVTADGDGDAFVAGGVSLIQAVERIHRGCRLCEADEDHTNDHARSAYSPPERASRRAFRNSRALACGSKPGGAP
ncbi:MAG: hypothetical protein JWO57_7 [Pseudonocardiales bacterium]|nr:hypothetical protein [Pseudonocardiales bacterium]